MKWRLIINREDDAFKNMAVDKALLMSKSNVPVLRFYSWKPSAVSIGFFQELEEEIDINECRKQEVDCVRRITGGGAVYHDKELTYSFCIPVKNDFFGEDILKSYEKICNPVIRGLREINIPAEYRFINDIVVRGKKISGNAQTRKNSKILQHGTILLDVDVDNMFRMLKVPHEKLKGKIIQDLKKGITSVKKELGKNINPIDLIRMIVNSFEKEFNIYFENSELTHQEKELVKIFYEDFKDEDWTKRKKIKKDKKKN